MIGARILDNLRRHFDTGARDFEPCNVCSPLAIHGTAPICALCREDRAAEEKRLAAMPPPLDYDPRDPSWGEQARDAEQASIARRDTEWGRSLRARGRA